MPSLRKIVNVAGHRFGRLEALSIVLEFGRDTSWLCRCDCGGTKTVAYTLLKSGRVTSCGCAKVVHGMHRRPEYNSWQSMIQRCTRLKHRWFRRYGGRGISVCAEWRHDFAAFYRYVGPRPSPRHSIDRINNDGNYEPGNVRWATREQQGNNRCPMPGRQCRTLDDQPITLRAIANHLAMTYGAYMYHTGRRA